ncbi:MAG TPA: heterodisulfide reductase-related iron-sulfur binding cluster [Blastocatellia bacterium]|jgi:glycolate oxidase iron-sulfur subunit
MVTTIEKSEARTKFASLLEENSERLLTCVHCGLCLPSCPTYRHLGDENDSPRGRVYLMRAVVEGRLGVGDSFISHIDQCLGCRACESVCPSSVPYGHLLEAARVEVAEAKSKRGSFAEFVVRLFLNQVFPRPSVLRAAMAMTRWLRDSGLARLAFDTRLVGGRLRFALALLLSTRSPLAKSAAHQRAPEVERDDSGSTGTGESRRAIRVALLRGCVMEGLFAETNRATERVLMRNGCEMVEAKGQVCCGALHAHAGQVETAKHLARKNIDAFLESGCERIITNAAGCGAAMKEYAVLLADDAQFALRARELSSRVRDISEFLTENGIDPPQTGIGRRVAYDAPCHLIHAQRVAQAPVEVLKATPGISLVPLRGFESCCGGAGIYNLQHPELSGKILDDKIESIKESCADTVATANPGCIMQIGAGALISGLDIDVIHPVEILDAAYRKSRN